MKILLTNDFWAEMDGERLFDTFKRSIFENSKERMGWTDEDDVPDEFVWEDIDRSFDIAWKTFIGFLKTVEGNEYLVMIGGIGRWDGRRGFTHCPKDIEKGISDFLKDCRDITVSEDENGDLYVTGVHHDGTNSMMIRILTDVGRKTLDEDNPFAFNPDDESMSKPFEFSKKFNIGFPSIPFSGKSWLAGKLTDAEWYADDWPMECWNEEYSRTFGKDLAELTESFMNDDGREALAIWIRKNKSFEDVFRRLADILGVIEGKADVSVLTAEAKADSLAFALVLDNIKE